MWSRVSFSYDGRGVMFAVAVVAVTSVGLMAQTPGAEASGAAKVPGAVEGVVADRPSPGGAPKERATYLEGNGEIARADLPRGIAELVSEEALDLASAPVMAEARANWDAAVDFVDQVDYQLSYRRTTDYLSFESEHVADLLVGKPDNLGIQQLGLFLTDDEVAEMQRRALVGDRMPAIRSEVTSVDSKALSEGENPDFGENFAGIWMDQMDGGVIVVAVVDLDLVDQDEVFRLAGGKSNVRFIEQRYSYEQIDRYVLTLLEELDSLEIEAATPVVSSPQGRTIEVQLPDPGVLPENFAASVPHDAFEVVVGHPFRELGLPQDDHADADMQPGLAIRVHSNRSGWADQGCTWGFNGHTSTYNYLVTASHCVHADFRNLSEWVGELTVRINQTYTADVLPWLTVGNTFIKSVYQSGVKDALRADSPFADDNCYHGPGYGVEAHCMWHMRNRALHNSWEVGSDQTCASLGSSNTYRCGFILEENYGGNRYARAGIAATTGDSGAGAKWDFTIDGLIVQGSSAEVLFMTAYDVQSQLGFQFNCAVGEAHKAPSDWGNCLGVDR